MNEETNNLMDSVPPTEIDEPLPECRPECDGATGREDNAGEYTGCNAKSSDAPEASAETFADPVPADAESPLVSDEKTVSEERVKQDETEALRSEVERLRMKIALRQKEDERMSREYAEFCGVYPDVSLKEINDSVWKDVENGIPLAAAFALWERKKIMIERAAKEQNRQNAERSAGALQPKTSTIFSPAEVRAMSHSEVRENYRQILYSMEKWNS